jgi:hypothetical protein
VEPIFFRADGSIKEAEMTTQGTAGPLDPLQQMDAERACLLDGNTRVEAFAADSEQLAGIKTGDKAAYKYFDFKNGVDSLIITVAPGANPGKIDIGLDTRWGDSIGVVNVPGNGDGKTWTTLKCKILPVAGVHAIWLRFSGTGEDLFKVDKFQFSK